MFDNGTGSYFTKSPVCGAAIIIPFVLVVALTVDALGFVALALFYPAREASLIAGGLLMLAALGLAAALRLAGVRSFWPYVAGAGAFSWFALFFGGFHPAFALLPILPFLPHARRDPGFFVDFHDRPGGPARAHEIRLQNGDCTTEIFQ